MDKTLEAFNSLYPVYKTVPFESFCVISEPKAESDTDFLRLDITECDGEQFPFDFAGQSIGFYDKANSREPMKSNCDGLFYTYKNGKKLLFLCELKSKFSTQEICHAKEQIVGTLIRLKAQLSILQAQPEWEIHGVIASYKPSTESLTSVKTNKDYMSKFSLNLWALKHKELNSERCDKFYAPISVPNITIHYVGVPYGQQHYQIPLQEILNL